MANPEFKFGTDDKNSIFRDLTLDDDMVMKINNVNVIRFSDVETKDKLKIEIDDPILVLQDFDDNTTTSHSTIRLAQTDQSSGNIGEFWDISSGITGSTDNFSFHIGKDEVMDYFTLTPTGDLGLGITNPSKKVGILMQ